MADRNSKGFSFHYDNLVKLLEENNSKLSDDFVNKDINKEKLITGKCGMCESPMRPKTYSTLVDNLNFGCEIHWKTYMANKRAEMAKTREPKEKNDYSNKSLQRFILEHGIKLKHELNPNDKITGSTPIEAECHYCDEYFCKSFETLFNKKIFACRDCIALWRYYKVIDDDLNANIKEDGSLMYYNRHSLKLYCEANGLVQDEIYDHTHITASSSIKLKCKMCNNKMTKRFERLVKEKNHGCREGCYKIFMKTKTENTCMVTYGVKHQMYDPEIAAKSGANNKITQMKEEVKEKRRLTMQKLYGVDHAMQNGEIANRQAESSYKSKKFIYPSGRIDKVQGDEPFALNHLIQIEKLNEDDIITARNNVPDIWYMNKGNKLCRYFVDIYIPSQNRCIEVKSTFTLMNNFDTVYLKQEAMTNAGYNFELWVYDAKKNRIGYEIYPALTVKNEEWVEL